MRKKFFHLPTKYAYLYFFIPITLSVIVSTNYDNDIWFLLNQGRYIFVHGFPHVDPFTIHENLSLVVQQWLSATIFYGAFRLFGEIGLSLLMIGVNLLILYFLYKIALVISENRKKLALFFTILVDVLLLMNFIQTRPQIFTYLILLMLMYLLEKYQQTNNTRYLFFLPLLSLLEINLHASMWFMLFLFSAPYVIEIIIDACRNDQQKKSFPLLFSMVLIFLVGLINPYGIEAITYIFTSYGNDSINQLVQEMQVPQITTNMGIIIYLIVLGVYLTYIITKNKTLKLKYICLLLGTTYLALSSYKGFAFFLIGGVLPLVSCLKNNFPVSTELKESKTPDEYKIIGLLSGLVVFLFIATPHQLTNSLKPVVDYLLSHEEKNKVILYTAFSEGGYVEYRGLKTYIDPRAEVFLKQNNHQKDIFQEYYDLQTGKLSPDEWIKDYPFTHFIVNYNDTLYSYLQQEKEKFELLLTTDEYFLFQSKI